jgi:hypothetical protein
MMGMAVLISLLGFGLVVFGGWLFMPGAPELPVLSAGDMPRLIVLCLGAGWSLLGGVQFLRHGRGLLAKGLLALLMLLSVGGTGLTAWWVLDASRVPPPVELAEIKGFALTDQHGNTVSDADLRGRPVVLIFARGVW